MYDVTRHVMIILKVGPLPPPERAISVSVRDASNEAAHGRSRTWTKPHMDGSAGRQLHVRALSIYVHRCFAIGLLCRRACVAPPCPHSLSRRPQRAGLQRSPRLSVSSVSVSDAWGFMGLLRIDGGRPAKASRMKFPDFGHGHGTDDRHGHQQRGHLYQLRHSSSTSLVTVWFSLSYVQRTRFPLSFVPMY